MAVLRGVRLRVYYTRMYSCNKVAVFTQATGNITLHCRELPVIRAPFHLPAQFIDKDRPPLAAYPLKRSVA